jgi:hypothetical protein
MTARSRIPSRGYRSRLIRELEAKLKEVETEVADAFKELDEKA